MRLERLEINGFKSFSDRAELAFDHGVTAIVGPNGCGKSNVADAITWVLGEQSAKSLRGDRMEDVIFSGSDARKPGATAEVRLRLTGLPLPPKNGDGELAEFHPTNGNGNGNGNGHHAGNGNGNGSGNGHIHAAAEMFTRDVEVTRRLYRSGESEYLIDGQVCRLRDVHELLMDTGLGAKAYAIIEQGKIGLILSSRPADRRQLIEEAAGITKYRSRRRAAELKLEAAQQNLTRIDDIVFEVEKQRGTLKRQAAKARRYRRLRDELRRWEKVLLVRRYRELSRTIESAHARLAQAREREAAAAARVAELEADLARLRIEQAEADSRAARVREDAHARELDINRREQQQEFNRQQAEELATRASEMTTELRELEARRDPARRALIERTEAAADAASARDAAAEALAEAAGAHAQAQQQIEGLEADVEAARSSVFATLNSATALRHAMEHAAAQRERVAATLAKLDVESADLGREAETAESDLASARDALARTRAALERIAVDSAARESELAAARASQEAHGRALREREQELARAEARLASLLELEASRAEFGDAARMVLLQANGRVGQLGAVADYLEVDGRYERAVEACLGDLLQYVVVERHDQAAAGLALVRDENAGRCGFVVIAKSHGATETRRRFDSTGLRDSESPWPVKGVVPISDVLRITGPYAETLRHVVPEAYIAETFDQAVAASRRMSAPVATLDGDVLQAAHLVWGGAKAEARGIFATRREIKELRERIAAERDELARAADEGARLEHVIAEAMNALAALTAERHRQDMAIVAHEAQVERASQEADRLARKADVIGLERRQAEEERAALDARYAEAETSIGRLFEDQRRTEVSLSDAQARLMSARDAVATLGARTAEARAAHAALTERAAAIAAEVVRLEEAAREIDQRIAARAGELEQAQARREGLLHAIADGGRSLDEDIRALEALRDSVRHADEAAADVRVRVDAQDAAIRGARHELEEIRANAGDLDVARATADSDLAHLAQLCLETLQCPLEEVLAEVEQLEQAGEATPDAAAITAEEPDPDAEEGEASTETAPGDVAAGAYVASGCSRTESGVMTAEEAIAALKTKIERLGPVNMMAIEQFDELESRHTFLTTQRKDLIDSIAQTMDAIKRIDETSTLRFNEAFAAIQENFQQTFSTLFGGGRAGLTLIDENDPLESGIDIVASPPGKRLQNVQLLSGGEKALTAIALMFAIFKYKPSPFCLLDEIDAPLDDANVGRFVEMLQGMLDRTQFILITHNRRTMEIANRLYGVTMEEPGVSKLISVQLN
ncbi:MAG: chromosome segregation protein SMC [Acidobacteria bacterium]|nr:chromosome segregation protein SMC [Acidobacteriota bacterium]